MIITEDEQAQLTYTYFEDKQFAAERALGFLHGMSAMMELVDKKLTAEREALELDQPQTKD